MSPAASPAAPPDSWHSWHTTGFFPRPPYSPGVFIPRDPAAPWIYISPKNQVSSYGIFMFRPISPIILVASSRTGPSILQRFN